VFRRPLHITIAACVTAFALAAGACANAVDTGEVSARSGKYGASLQTSTTVAGSGLSASRGRSGVADRRADATENLLNALAEDPTLLENIDNLTPEQLSELTGLSSDELGTLGITPATVGALGGVIRQIGRDEEGNIDPAAAAAVLTSTGALTEEARAALAVLDPATLAVLVGTAATVPTTVTQPLGVLLQILDPNGLGQFAGDNTALAVIAVLMGAILGRDPVALGQLQNAEDIDPRFRGVLGALANIATTLSPQFIERVNRVTSVLGPYALRAIGAAVGLLERPAVAELISTAVADPVVVGTSFGSLLLLIPGLPELIAPETFADPNAIYGAVLGVAAAALVNMDAPGFRDFLTGLGVVIPPELLD
jgi:hypothetical protein